jgi:hypothetical protein
VALFFTFYGYYMTMLWLPAGWGLLLFASQVRKKALKYPQKSLVSP